MNPKSKKNQEDWLGLGLNENDDISHNNSHDTRFENKIYDSKKGKLLLELQKTFKGDDRFKLGKKFKNDVEFEKLPNSVKQANKDLEFDLEDEKQEVPKHKKNSLEIEKDSQFNILKALFPQERIRNDQKSKNITGKNLILPRFDPSKPHTNELIIKETPKIAARKKKENKIRIDSGVDKKKKNLLKADSILKKTIHKTEKIPEKAKKLIKHINYEAWKTLTQKTQTEEDNSAEPLKFKLFSK